MNLIGGVTLAIVNFIILAFALIGFFVAGGAASREEKGAEGERTLLELIAEGFEYFFE